MANHETTLAMAALYAEEQGWPGVREITPDHLEDYLAYLQGRIRWFGERTYAQPKRLSKGHINGQYRRLHRFFNWLVERGYADETPLSQIEPPSLDEKTVPVVTEDQMRDLLTLADPALARTSVHHFRLVRDRALLYTFWDTPGRLAEIAKLQLDDVDLTTGTLLVMGKGRKERRMPIGDAAKAVLCVLWDYLQERKALTPRTRELCVDVGAGRSLAAQRDLPDPEAFGRASRNGKHAPPRVPPFLRYQCPAGGNARAGAENSRRLEEDSRDLLQDFGRGGRH